MASATVAEEEYLQTLFWLQEAKLPMTGANVARAMQLSAPTVHEMVGRLERDGYITRDADKAIAFTPSGREHAEHLEHAMSPRFEAYVRAAVGYAETCPHGHPIRPGRRIEGVPLADVEEGASVRVLRFENEAEDLLHYLKDTGLRPGLEGTLARSGDDEIVVDANGDSHSVTRSVAETV